MTKTNLILIILIISIIVQNLVIMKKLDVLTTDQFLHLQAAPQTIEIKKEEEIITIHKGEVEIGIKYVDGQFILFGEEHMNEGVQLFFESFGALCIKNCNNHD